MRFATLKDGSLDGRLVLVSSTGLQAVDAAPIATSLLAAVQNWDAVEPALRERAAALEAAGFADVAHVVHGFEGDLNDAFKRSSLNGWRYDGLPWEQM